MIGGRKLIVGVDAALEQIRAGMAWVFRRYAKELPPDQCQQYDDAEDQARDQRRGLWVDAAPIAPWEWSADRR
jgi:endonuclease YncB( thermonuclease family)